MQTDPLLSASRAYVETWATPRERLAAVAGVSETALDKIGTAGALPAPTYVLYADAIQSPIRNLGTPPSATAGRAYYCPSVVWWVRRAALSARDASLLRAMEAWFTASFLSALHERAGDARRYAWSHLFGVSGALDEAAVNTEIRQLCGDWLKGGWAVCLRRWDGGHVVTKNLERARIIALTEDGKRDDLSTDERLTLLGAIDRLDSVMLPFAPHERPHGTPGLYVDAMRLRYGLWR